MELRDTDIKWIAALAREIGQAASVEAVVRKLHGALRKGSPVDEIRLVMAERHAGWRQYVSGLKVANVLSLDKFPLPSEQGTTASFDPAAPGEGYLWAAGLNPRGACLLGLLAPHVATAVMVTTAMRRVRTSAQQERELARAAIRSRDEERRRISQELHDDLGQSLASLKLSLKWAEDAVRSKKRLDEAANELSDGREAVGMILGKVRDLSHTLHPSILDTLGLAAAIKELVHQATRRSSIEVVCSTSGQEKPLRKEVAAGLYRCCQEAVSNALRHSMASRVAVELLFSARDVRMTVEDNGKGLSPESHPGSEGSMMSSGFWTIRQRVADLDGAFRVSTAPGSGVTLEITIPTNVRIFDVRRKDKAARR